MKTNKSGPRTVLSQRAYEIIRKRIVEREYSPGEPILESSLSSELGISRTPVREALKLLEKENLVVTHPGRGAFISSVPLEKVREIFQIREIIEGEVGRRVAPYIPVDTLDRIEAKLSEVKKRFLDEGAGIEEAVLAGRDLHELIFSVFGNRILTQFMETLRFEIERGCDFASQKADNSIVFLGEHLEIIAALKENDGEKVRLLLERHVRRAKEALLD